MLIFIKNGLQIAEGHKAELLKDYYSIVDVTTKNIEKSEKWDRILSLLTDTIDQIENITNE